MRIEIYDAVKSPTKCFGNALDYKILRTVILSDSRDKICEWVSERSEIVGGNHWVEVFPFMARSSSFLHFLLSSTVRASIELGSGRTYGSVWRVLRRIRRSIFCSGSWKWFWIEAYGRRLKVRNTSMERILETSYTFFSERCLSVIDLKLRALK